MGKIPSIPDKTTQQSMETCDEIAADSCGSERTISDDLRITGHGYTDGLEVDSASRSKRAVVKSKSLQYIPLDRWLKEIDSGEGVWKAAKSFRSDGTADNYYFHEDYDKPFRSKPEVLEFIRTGTVKGKIIKKRSANTRSNVHDHRQTTKRQRTGAATSSNTSGEDMARHLGFLAKDGDGHGAMESSLKR